MARSRRRRDQSKKRRKASPKRRRATLPKRRPARKLPPKKPVARKKPAPKKPTKRRKKPAEIKQAPSQRALRLEDRETYWIRGKQVPKGTRGAKKLISVVQLDPYGKIIRQIEKATPKKIVKLVVPSKLGFFEEEGGARQGRIDWALIHSSVSSDINKAKRVEVAMRWQDARGKTTRRKLSLNLEFVRKKQEMPNVLTQLILDALRDAGFRTNYSVQVFKEARRKGLKEPITWADWRALEIAQNLEIIVTLWT